MGILMEILSADDIFAKLKRVMMDAFAVEANEVTRWSKLCKDFRADDMDFMDLVYRIEQAFRVKINADELFPEEMMPCHWHLHRYKFSSERLAEVKAKMTFVELFDETTHLNVREWAELYTVDTLVRYLLCKQVRIRLPQSIVA
ncbi:TPA: hypothetical protein DCQ44_00195 [Candidatus Taylorbacteria bacterium]|nr:hypothetical protein [Candidatus Taylorbacteria bacterium]